MDFSPKLKLRVGGKPEIITDGKLVREETWDHEVELTVPTQEDVLPIQEDFSEFVRKTMTEAEDVRYLQSYENHEAIRDYYNEEVYSRMWDILFCEFSETHMAYIRSHLTIEQRTQIVRIVDEYFSILAVLKSLEEAEGKK